jgi:hypothetical protein
MLPALCRRATEVVEQMTAQHASTVFYALGCLGYRDSVLLDAVSDRILGIIGSCEAITVTNILYGSALANYYRSDLAEAVCLRGAEVLVNFGGRELARCLAALAVRGLPITAAVDGLTEFLLHRLLLTGIVSTLHAFDAQLLLGVLVRLREDNRFEDLVHASSMAITQRVSKPGFADSASFDMAAHMVWCTAILGVVHPLAMKALSARLQHPGGIARLGLDSVVSIAWAFAKLRDDQPSMMTQLARRAVQFRDSMQASHCASLLWSFATLNCPATDLFEACTLVLPKILAEATPDDIANMMWAFATLRADASAGAAELLGDAYANLKETPSGQNAAVMAWALVTMGAKHPDALRVLARATIADQDALDVTSAANLCWAFARLGSAPPQLIVLLARRVVAMLDGCPPRGLVNTAWALASVNVAAQVPDVMVAIAKATMRPDIIWQLTVPESDCLLRVYAPLIPDH